VPKAAKWLPEEMGAEGAGVFTKTCICFSFLVVAGSPCCALSNQGMLTWGIGAAHFMDAPDRQKQEKSSDAKELHHPQYSSNLGDIRAVLEHFPFKPRSNVL
jgi:hypothetical protein